MEPEVGSILEGKVTSITKFGAFVSLGNGKSGLVHISEIANTFVNDVHDYLQEGQDVKVLVLSTENNRINLSIKKAQPREERPARETQPPHVSGGRPGGARPFGGGAPRPFNGAPRPFSPRPAGGQGGARFQQPLAATGDLSFEDKLKQFMTTSEGKMADLNRNIDGKRGGRRRK